MTDNFKEFSKLKKEICDFLYSKKLPLGRLLTHSKTTYLNNNKHNTVVFNSNIYIHLNGENFLVWNGDIDLSLEGDILIECKNITGIDLYVFVEHVFISVDTIEILKSNSIWDTTKLVPFYDDIDKIFLDNAENLLHKTNFHKNYLNRVEDKLISNNLPKKEITKLFNRKLHTKISFSLNELYDFFNKCLNDKIITNDANTNEDIFYYQNQEHLFSTLFLDYFLDKNFKITEGYEFDYSCFWINEKTNNLFLKLNYEFEYKNSCIEEDFNYGSFLAVLTYENSNKLNICNDSIDYCEILVFDNFIRKKIQI